MRIPLTLAALLALTSISASAAENCREIHGRAAYYRGDGQLRIWHIGTHHEFSIDEGSTSWNLLLDILGNDGSKALYADFTVCPISGFVKGAAQEAAVTKIRHPHIAKW
jgi:hypothetical protein